MNLTAGGRSVAGGDTRAKGWQPLAGITLEGHESICSARSEQRKPRHPSLLCTPFSSAGVVITHPEHRLGHLWERLSRS